MPAPPANQGSPADHPPKAGAPDAGSAHAHEAGEPDDEQLPEDSPRASLAQFVAYCRTGQYDKAGAFLELPRDLRGREAELAEKLKAVLDRKAWIDLDKISPLSTGDLEDGLPRNYEEIARFQQGNGVPEPVRLVKRDIEGGRWRFTISTTTNIDAWYARLEDRWMREHLPDWLMRTGPRELLWWQWLALPVVVLIAAGLGYLLARVSAKVLLAIATRTRVHWDDEFIKRLRRPFTLCWTLVLTYAAVPWLGLYQPAQTFVHGLLRAGLLAAFFWILSRGVGLAGEVLTLAPWARRMGASHTLIPLGTRVAHVTLFAIAAVAMLAQLGYPVASLIAGLGLGGLAVALAAQKTLENLFGAFAIGADQPFREGDFVKIEDFVATVESIGLRSTRFRTLDRTVITIPNGKLAEMRVESFARRDRLRFACTLSLVYGTRPEQVTQVIEGVEHSLRAQPKLHREGLTVRLFQLGTSSVDIEVMAWFDTLDWPEFQRIREELLLSFMHVVGDAGTALALPMQGMQTLREFTREEQAQPELSHE